MDAEVWTELVHGVAPTRADAMRSRPLCLKAPGALRRIELTSPGSDLPAEGLDDEHRE